MRIPLVMISLCLLATGCRNSLPALIDAEGNRYRVVQIGTQVWMAENLRVSTTPDRIPVRTHFPNNDSSQAGTYGLLYDFQTALRVAPAGWHIPTDEEWNILSRHLGTAGAAELKDTLYWSPSGTKVTNATGFDARPAGYWNESGFDNRFNHTAVFWSSTPADSHFVWSRSISADHDTLRRAQQHPQYGFSVRCIKDRQ